VNYDHGMRLRWLLIACVLVAGCKKRSGAPEADLEVARVIANDSLGKIEAALAAAKAGTPRSPAGSEACAAALGVVPQLRLSTDVLLATKLEELCTHDLPFAELAAAVATVDGDAAACAATGHVTAAIAMLERGRPDPEASNLAKRYRARCP
jgi:hypothetical protein